MKKLHSLAFYALVTPAIALGAGSALAQQSDAQNADRQQQGTQSYQGADKSDQQKSADRMQMGDKSGMQTRGYMSAVPAEGRQASELMGADVRTADDENIGSVNDLIIDKDGQVVAIVVSVGGFLGMGEKDVAIAWDNVTQTGTAEEQQLRVDVSRDELSSAPEFEKRD
ncbi:PRC-barrel domain-containing protein [Marinobacter halophilus]|uniref:PRC-barrel domain-containing protein n=1 Tax=Marinobacter halophilus TaxID=1323740 RepID=A0A2T1KI80_9GAMM|nr:PRC-barrel domain-containing protein [Marinobacter halophilus]PSF09302.1 hypothetical protein C7H08_04300 [Marinobacter halophilus]GGC79057.1 hypothetical protein GCM10011362_29540 [Marinobacter halophilus]